MLGFAAVLVQAEALYGMGEFERALVLYERGARSRPDMIAFSRGGHKCREAILNAIGGKKKALSNHKLMEMSIITSGDFSNRVVLNMSIVGVNIPPFWKNCIIICTLKELKMRDHSHSFHLNSLVCPAAKILSG